jgi:hypothetical protein
MEELKGKPEIIKALRKLYDIDLSSQNMISQIDANAYDAELNEKDINDILKTKDGFEELSNWINNPSHRDEISKMNINKIKKIIDDEESYNTDLKYVLDFILDRRKDPTVITTPKKGLNIPDSSMVDVQPIILHRNAFAKQWGDSMKLDYKSAQQNQQQKDDFKKYSTDPSKYKFPMPTKTPAKPVKPKGNPSSMPAPRRRAPYMFEQKEDT